jgi:hypothetical protein
MWFALTRRIAVFVLAMAMALGLSAHAMRAAHMDLKAAAATAADIPASGMPASSKCDGCGDDQKAISPAACSAYCSSIVALPTTCPILGAVPHATPGHSEIPIATGHAFPPDPYPPRPSILS